MAAKTSAKKVLVELRQTARVASVMVDGEEALRIITDRAMRYIANPDPAHVFLSGD